MDPLTSPGASTESWNPQLPEAFVPGSRFLLATKGSGGQPPPATGIAVNPGPWQEV